MVRLTVNIVAQPGLAIRVSAADEHYLTAVMRRRPGDLIEVLAAEEQVWLAEWSGEGKLLFQEMTRSAWSPRRHITLYQALLKNDHWSDVVDRATQAGVSRIVPLLTERCIVREIKPNRLARWHTIAKEASEQSRRSAPPEIGSLIEVSQLMASPAAQSYALAPSAPGERPWLIECQSRLELVVGPEGGLAPQEIERLAERGFLPLSIGGPIFRSENAGAFAAILFLQ